MIHRILSFLSRRHALDGVRPGDHDACSSGDRPNHAERIPPPPPPPPPLSPRDLISALPDDVIHCIFLFLPLRDVVKTSVLSERWRYTWTSITDLVLVVERRGRPLAFQSLVDSVLSQRTSPTVKKFHIIGVKCDEANCRKLDLWLRFAAGCHVEDLHLRTIPWDFYYTLPRFLYSLSWLVRLEVSGCCFSLGTVIRWPCLKVLLIRVAELSEDIFEKIVGGSPVLESLELRTCRGLKNIRIDSTSVKELVLFPGIHMEKLWAPHLLSLQISGWWMFHDFKFRLDNVSSLVEAKLDFVMCTRFVNDDKPLDFLKELFEKLRGVPTIDISSPGRWCLQIMSFWEKEGLPSPLSKCQNLILRGPVSQWTLPGIACMLQSSPCLEKLVIHLTGPRRLLFEPDDGIKERFKFDEEDFFCSMKESFECLAKHLKRVEITSFKSDSFGSEHLLALIKFLLGDALVLEKLIVKARYVQHHYQAAVLPKLLAVSKNVLSYRRASKNAEVIFDYPLEFVSPLEHMTVKASRWSPGKGMLPWALVILILLLLTVELMNLLRT